jgi:NarL family two-component system sensor histidine kinase LiaS
MFTLYFLIRNFLRMRREKRDGVQADQRPVSQWSGLRAHMTFTFFGVTLAFLVVILTVRLTIFFLLKEPSRDLFASEIIVLTVPGLSLLDGTLAGFVATRRPIKRLRRLVGATAQFADGNYAERVQVSRQDEIGQLEHHFNQMAEQLAESIKQRQMLAEQNARLAERSRLSRDLHDSVKQELFAVSMQIGAALAQGDANSEATRKHLVEADTLISQAQQNLTALIHELRPSILQQKGLPAALREQALTWSRQQGIAVDLQLSEEKTAPLAVEEALWWVAQEALSNVARHSQATSVQICLEYTPEQVMLLLADNGRGFDMSNGAPSGVGLRSMRERLAAIGGTVSITSRLGEGTRVQVCCPLPHALAGSAEATTRKAEQ